MKATKWQRTVSLLLCLLMAMSFFVITAPEAYAAEPDWPYLESIDEYVFENKNLSSDFPAAEDNLKKMEIQQANSLTECDVATDGATKTYHVGTIALYVEKFPTAADSTAKSYGFTFNIPKEGTGSAVKSKVTLKNTGENYTEVFYGKAMLYASFGFQQHDEWSYYIMTEDKVAYHYDVQVLQYTGESEDKPEPTWPYLESIDEYAFENKNLNSDFPAAEDNLKKMEIQQANSLTECDVATDGATKTYHVGTIALYVEKFPTAADSTAKSYGFTFNIPKEGTGSAVKSKVTLKNTGENYTEVFYGKAMLYASFGFQQHDEWSYYIMTEDKVAYHYDVQVLQYTGESEDKPEPTWPYLESIDEYAFENKNLNSDFPAAEDNLKKMEIQQANSLTECDVATDGATKTYHVGTIALYVEKFPTAADSTAKSYGFTFNIPKEGTGSAVKSKVTLKNTGENYTEVFYGKAMLYASFGFQQHDEWSYYIMTEDKVAYHYDVQVLQYTGESEDKPEPTWPYLESIDEYAFENKNLNSDFPAAEDNLKKMEIQQANSLTECDVATDGATKTYHVGTIALYVEKIPTAADSTAKSYGFTFNIPKEGTGSAAKSKVTLKNTGENYTEVFYGKAMLYASFEFQQHDEWSYYIMTEDKVAYHYDVQVLQYTGESGEELTLSNGSAKRTDKETATVTFNASSTGNYYYALCDEQQTTPAVDSTSSNTNTGAMAKSNTITVSGITDYKAKYLYIVGVDAAGKTSAPLEIVIPGITFALKHEKQSIYSVSLYTEQFTDIEGKPITAATPGDTVIVNFGVFEAGNEKVIYEDGAIKHKADVRQTVLKQWNITELTLDPAPTGSSFRFTMPGNEVTIQAETKLAGVPIQLTSNMPTVKPVLRASAYFTNPYDLPGGNVGYSLSICNNQNQTDVVPAGTKVKLSVASIQGAYVLDMWAITNNGTAVDGSKITRNEDGSAEFTLEEGGDYMFTAVLRAKKFASVTAAVNDSTMGSATVTVDGNQQAVYEGQNVTLTAVPGSRYMLERWEVKDAAGNAIDTTAVEGDANKATFVMPSTDSAITATAFFEVDPDKASTENALTAVELDVPGATVSRSGSTFTITLPAGTNTSKLGEKILKLTISDFATVTKEGDPDKDWTEGTACGMELDKAATFTVTAQKGNTQTYTIIITKAKSSEKDITAAVLLNQTGDTTPFARAKISETEITFTLPSDTDKAVLNSIGMKYLKLTYPESATVKMKDGYDDATNAGYRWSNGDVMCNMSINSPVKFTVTAEDGSTKEYTIEIKYTAPAAPTLSDGSATRSSKTAATVKFTTNEAGTYYYKVVTHGATAPTADEIMKSTTKGTASAGETTFTLSNLTEDARDVYIVVVSAAGGESAPLKVEIPAYGSGTDTPDTGAYKISISAPKGGTITTNRTKADAGDEIIVTVTPDNGYQMVSGSLTYTLATAGGETKTITNGRFTMPEGDVSITCKWETATTTAKGITSFSINGIAGAVNNTTNTITITMPRGTDVTKLTPTISTNGVKSLTPGSGETVNFTNSVNYTATMEDGSTKTYTVTVYVEKGTLSDQFWDKLTDFVNQVPWWEYAKHQQSTSSYPKYW